ncbi:MULTISPECIES: BTAD domain-containing putative transcriptional regulator [Streptacidiphilus]|uniref:BTAD domain-containing putative transcriptional regulator n=2 Tax=Streptacidiphilus TaxID=228398 RepID=A0ABV6UNH7_9ACTN|nr:BTAD domain-containing putative transcriptional regulator [Streptacidiphilus jeojiense]
MSAAQVRVSVLGPMELTVDGRPVAIGAPQTRTVLALLALGSGSVVPIDRIIEGVWGERSPRSAVLKVQGHVSALRKALHGAGAAAAAAVLVTRPPGYQLGGEGYCCDMDEFTGAARRASALAAAGDAEASCELLDQALRHWRGPAFADVPGDEVRLHAARLEQLRSIALEDKAAHDLRRGRFWAVLEDLGPELDSNPLGERARELVIHAYLRLGQRHAALACYEAGRTLLQDELGISPGQSLQRLAHLIRHGAAPGVEAGV